MKTSISQFTLLPQLLKVFTVITYIATLWIKVYLRYMLCACTPIRWIICPWILYVGCIKLMLNTKNSMHKLSCCSTHFNTITLSVSDDKRGCHGSKCKNVVLDHKL